MVPAGAARSIRTCRCVMADAGPLVSRAGARWAKQLRNVSISSAPRAARRSRRQPDLTSGENDRFSWNSSRRRSGWSPSFWPRRSGRWARTFTKLRRTSGRSMASGLDLRFMIDGELRHSQVFRDWQLLDGDRSHSRNHRSNGQPIERCRVERNAGVWIAIETEG
jgi:hypothetical protein